MQYRRTEAQWRAIFDEWARSGLSQEQFCKREGISMATFSSWRRKLRAASLVPRGAGFVEVCISDPARVTRTAPETQPDLVVELPYGVVLRFHGVRP
jgi:transposase-like protein